MSGPKGTKRAGIAVAFVLVTTYVLLVTFRVAGPEVRALAGNLTLSVVAGFTGWSCWRGARTAPHRVRRGWLLLAAATASWSCGQVLWIVNEHVRHEQPFPSIADVFYVGFVPLAVAAVLTFLHTPTTRSARIAALGEALLITTSTLLTSWLLVLRPLVDGTTGTVLERTVALAYPLGDVLIAALVTFVTIHSRRGSRQALVFVVFGLFGFAASDSSFVVTTFNGTYRSGSVVDIGWIVGFLFIAAAARRPQVEASERTTGDGRLVWLGRSILFTPVVVAFVTGIFHLAEIRKDDIANALVVAFGAAIISHEIITGVQHTHLTRFLERKVTERTTEANERKLFFRSLVQNASEAMVVLDANYDVIYNTPAALEVFGMDPTTDGARWYEQARPDALAIAFKGIEEANANPGSSIVVEAPVDGYDGTDRTVQVTITSMLHDPVVRGIIINARDVTVGRTLERRLAHQAFHDSLTGLPNRLLFRDRLEHGLARVVRQDDARLAVMFVDLDGFKAINDGLGHSVGDELLRSFAERVKAMLRPGDTLARLGGDEFAVLLEDQHDVDDAPYVAQRVLALMHEPFSIGGRSVNVNASIGIATSECAATTEELLRNADVAMYRAKALGKGRYQVFEPEMHASALERLELEVDLRQAIDTGQLFVVYQPLVDLATAEVVSAEALVRWNHPTRGLLEPAVFIQAAEETGLVVALGRFVLRQACREAATWTAADGTGPGVSVNVTARQLAHPDFVDDVATALGESGLSPSRLVLELTESMLVDGPSTLDRLLRLKELGVTIAIDDFGTGYSSLSYLRQFPVDMLKVDRSFVASMSEGAENVSLVRAIVGMGHTLQLRTIAEGVETDEQVQTLREMGCPVGQGYLFSRPIGGDELASYMMRGTRPAESSPLAGTGDVESEAAVWLSTGAATDVRP